MQTEDEDDTEGEVGTGERRRRARAEQLERQAERQIEQRWLGVEVKQALDQPVLEERRVDELPEPLERPGIESDPGQVVRGPRQEEARNDRDLRRDATSPGRRDLFLVPGLRVLDPTAARRGTPPGWLGTDIGPGPV